MEIISCRTFDATIHEVFPKWKENWKPPQYVGFGNDTKEEYEVEYGLEFF